MSAKKRNWYLTALSQLGQLQTIIENIPKVPYTFGKYS